MQTLAANRPCCRFHRTPEPPSSSSPAAKSSSFLGAHVLMLKGIGPLPRASCGFARVRGPAPVRRRVVKAVATPDSMVELPLMVENVESVLDEIRPYLISDEGNVALHEIDGNVVRFKLQGGCSSCTSSKDNEDGH